MTSGNHGSKQNTARIWQLQALTDIWTGDVYGKKDRLISTGLLGSIRWWFEVVVRGLGGKACDPSHHRGNKPGPCPNTQKKVRDPGHHCVVCELFGCTGWARKFRFDVLDADGHAQQDQIKQGTIFQLAFTPLRPVRREEWTLLDATLRLIADYAAIGGKTVYKPSDELALANATISGFNNDLVLRQKAPGSPLNQNDRVLRIDGKEVTSRRAAEAALTSRAIGESARIEIERNGESKVLDGWTGKRHHQDYGLIRIEHPAAFDAVSLERLQAYVGDQHWRRVNHDDFAWASLENFWCISGQHLARQSTNYSTFNAVICRPEPKRESHKRDSWIAGRRASQGNDPESKKVFSFKNPENARRTFGFISPEREMPKRLGDLLEENNSGSFPADLADKKVTSGREIRELLLDGLDKEQQS